MRDVFHQLSQLIDDLLHGGSFCCEQIPGRLSAEASAFRSGIACSRVTMQDPAVAPSVQAPWRLSGVKHHRRKEFGLLQADFSDAVTIGSHTR